MRQQQRGAPQLCRSTRVGFEGRHEGFHCRPACDIVTLWRRSCTSDNLHRTGNPRSSPRLGPPPTNLPVGHQVQMSRSARRRWRRPPLRRVSWRQRWQRRRQRRRSWGLPLLQSARRLRRCRHSWETWRAGLRSRWDHRKRAVSRGHNATSMAARDELSCPLVKPGDLVS